MSGARGADIPRIDRTQSHHEGSGDPSRESMTPGTFGDTMETDRPPRTESSPQTGPGRAFVPAALIGAGAAPADARNEGDDAILSA